MSKKTTITIERNGQTQTLVVSNMMIPQIVGRKVMRAICGMDNQNGRIDFTLGYIVVGSNVDHQ